jgi:hypothetical protein
MSLIPLLDPVVVRPAERSSIRPLLDPDQLSALTIEEQVRLQNLLWWTVYGHLVEVCLLHARARRPEDQDGVS